MIIEKILDNQMSSMPQEVFYCSKCVNSNQRPRLSFDENGVCDACRFAEEKDKLIDWDKREEELLELLDRFRSKDGSYDVIVPGSGGKDSSYVAHQLKYEYGMHPLCVTWAPAIYTDIGWENMQSFTKLFDTIICFPNRNIHAKLSRLGFELVGDPFAPWHYGQRAYPLHAAVQHKIPLLFYGENTGAEYGGRPESKNKAVETIADKKKLDAYRAPRGIDAIIEEGLKHGIFSEAELKNENFSLYRNPPVEDMEKLGIEMRWFSYYKKWVPQDNFYYATKHCGFKPNTKRSEGTYSKYSSIDDKIDGLHFYMQYIKFGFGRCISEASQEIRSGHITRDEGVALAHKYDGEFPQEHFMECLEYMGITEEYFWKVIDKFRASHLWGKVDGEWQMNHKVK